MMKRFLATVTISAALVGLTSTLYADVKTKEKVIFRLEGVLGKMVNMFGGSAARDGITSTVAVKGNRLSRISDSTGQIIDLAEQKVYDLDIKKKEYRVTTFDELRHRFQEAKDKAEKEAKNRPPQEKGEAEQAGKELEFEASVKETGQHKTIAGHETREVVLTITAHEKGKKLEDSGGMILTNDMWMGPKVAALDEIVAFEQKYFQAVFGQAFGIDPQQTASLAAMFPSFQKMSAQMQSEGKKMQGTALFTTMTFDAMKSAEQMKADADQSGGGGGGGISGRLGGLLAKKMKGGPSQQRSTIMTTTMERLSIEPAASAEDVAIPAGFKEKK